MLHKNICLIGPPGSGKGSYGRHLAKALGIPLVTSSDVLRKSFDNNTLDLSSGKLVDDKTVSRSLLDGLKKENFQAGYILDGFPRTLQQVHLMEDTWPIQCQVQAAIKLAVPDRVCKIKLLGRRICERCGEKFSINGVDFEQWDLPPSHPVNCPDKDCNPDKDWATRPDDAPGVVDERLAIYHEHMDPILEYFDSQNRLLKLTPYKGYDDLPMIISTVQKWLQEIEDKKI